MIPRMSILTSSIFLMFLLVSSVTLTNFAYAQSTPKPLIVVNNIIQKTPVVVANSPDNEFVTSVINKGDAAGTRKIPLGMIQNYGSDNESRIPCKSNGTFEVSVTLNPGESTNITWQCPVYGSGAYQLTTIGKTFDFQVVEKEAYIKVQKVTVDPDPPKVGNNALFTITVHNYDAVYGTKNIVYKLTFYSTPPFDAEFGSKRVSLIPGESETFEVVGTFSSSDPWKFFADEYVYDPVAEELHKQLKRDIEESKTEEEKQADEDRKQLKKDAEEYDKEQEQERESEQQEEEEIDDTDEIEEEAEQVTGSKLVVTDVIITPRKNLKPNDIVTITAVVKNVGDVEGTKSIVPVINAPVAGKSATVDAKSVTIKPGKEKQLTWQIPILVGGVYDVFVDGKGDSFQVKSVAQDTKKTTDTSGKKKFDIDDAADFDDGKTTDTSDKKFDIDDAADFDANRGNRIIIEPISDEITDDVLRLLKEHNEKYNKKQPDPSGKKPFDIDDAADFDTYDGESNTGSFDDGILSSEDLDRIKNVSDMQVIDDMESIREKILSVDFDSVVGTSDDNPEIKIISQKYDAANDKLRIAIEKRELVVDLKQQLEKEQDKNKKLRNQAESDSKRWKQLHEKSNPVNQSGEDKLHIFGAGEDALESADKLNVSNKEIRNLEDKIQELESEADMQYNDAMKDLDSISDDLDKANQVEPNYEDKNQNPFVTDDLKKETYQNDVSRSIDDIMKVTEEYEKNRDALQKQDELKQIIRDTPVRVASATTFNKIMNSEFASNTFYPGDIESLLAVDQRANFQDAVWEELSDSGTLEAYKEKTIQKLEQKSESNIQQISAQTPLVDKLQDSSYFGTVPLSENTDDVSTILFSGYDANFGNNIISADIPIDLIYDDENTAKYSVLGGNLAIVDPTTKQIEDVMSVAFGKGRIDHQNNKMTFLINVVDSSGQHQTITLSSAEKSKPTVAISGKSELDVAYMEIRRSLLIESMSDNLLEEAILAAQIKSAAKNFIGSEYIPSVDEWKKLVENKKLAEQKKNDALKKYNDAIEEKGNTVRALVDLVDAEKEYNNAAEIEKDARGIIDREAKAGRIDKTARTGGY